MRVSLIYTDIWDVQISLLLPLSPLRLPSYRKSLTAWWKFMSRFSRKLRRTNISDRTTTLRADSTRKMTFLSASVTGTRHSGASGSPSIGLYWVIWFQSAWSTVDLDEDAPLLEFGKDSIRIAGVWWIKNARRHKNCCRPVGDAKMLFTESKVTCFRNDSTCTSGEKALLYYWLQICKSSAMPC